MNLLVVRHAIAEEREEFARSGEHDSQRPLTTRGRKRMQRGARGLARLVPSPSLLASSPFTRAMQTAEIVAAAFGNLDVTTANVLTPDAEPEEFVEWVEGQSSQRLVAIVGHEPHLSGLVSWFLAGSARPLIEFKKGAACLLELGGDPRRGSAVLLWSLTPAQLRALG